MELRKRERIKRLAVRLVDRLGGYILTSNILSRLGQLSRMVRQQRLAA